MQSRCAPLPDLSAEDEIADVTPGPLRITIYGINVADFDFDSFTYTSLGTQRWSAWSVDTIVAQR